MLKKTSALLLGTFCFLFSAQSFAQTNNNNCWVSAGNYYNINPWVLYSIASVESNHNITAINDNTNGTTDMGIMQINTLWLDELSQYNIKEKDLMDGCNAIFIGAWILAKRIDAYGSSWKAVGTYHSKTPNLRNSYAYKVYKRYYKLLDKAGYTNISSMPSFNINSDLPFHKQSSPKTVNNYSKTIDEYKKKSKQKVEFKYKKSLDNSNYAINNSEKEEINFRLKENNHNVSDGRRGY